MQAACASGWTNGNSHTADGTISVSSSNILTATAITSQCPFNFGSVNLIGNYNNLSTPLNFTVKYTWSNSETLTIKLIGSPTSGTPNTGVGVGRPIFTPAGGLTDIAGNPMTGPVTATSDSRF